MIKKAIEGIFRGKTETEADELPILTHPDPLVSSLCFEYGDDEPLDLELAAAMRRKLLKMKAVSLSANQVGVLKRLSVYSTTADERQIVTCFNPRIVKTGRNFNCGAEGTLSVPMRGQLKGPVVNVQRYDTIEVEYLNEKREVIHRKLRGWEARIFQHEIDQLDGIFVRKLIDQKTEIKSAKIS